MDVKKIFKKHGFLIRLCVSAGLILFLLTRIDGHRILSLLGDADYRLFAAALAVSFLKQGIEIYKTTLLIREKGIKVRFAAVAKIMFTSTFVGTFMPSSLGVEIFRAYGFSRYTSESAHSVSAVAVNRFLSLFSLMIMASVSAVLNTEYAGDVGIFWIVVIFSIPLFLVGVGFISSIRKVFSRYIFSKSSALAKFGGWVGDVGKSFYEYRNSRGTLAAVTALSVLFQVARVIVCYLLALTLGVELPVSYFFIFIPLVLLFTMIPLSVGGIGMREGGVVYFLGKAGVDPGTAFSVSLMWFAAAVVSSLPGMYFYLTEGMEILKRSEDDTAKETR